MASDGLDKGKESDSDFRGVESAHFKEKGEKVF